MDTSTSQKQATATAQSSDGPKLDSRHRFKLLEDCRELVLEKLSGVITKAAAPGEPAQLKVVHVYRGRH